MTEEEHEFGKALIGLIAMMIVSLLVGFCMLSEANPVPINYIDDITSIESENLA
jgi:hypothetical protein